jgi:NADH-quinone oxidoreductase subunit M
MQILSLLTFVPLIGCMVLLFVPRTNNNLIKWIGLAFTLLAFLLSIQLTVSFNPNIPGYQFQEKAVWIPQLNVNYHMGVDGLSVPMIFLTGIITFLAGIASWNINQRTKEYWILYLLLETGMMGTFVSLDLFLFYIFWEIMLVPMYFLIGVWGGPRKEYAAIKFFLYTLAGSVLMLLGFLALYFTTNPHTLSIPELSALGQQGLLFTGDTVRFLGTTLPHLVFLGLFIGFAIKVPVWPVHTWLPDAHVEAPTPISVILAAVLLKMGAYGFFRISHPILPQAAKDFSWLFVWLGVIGIVYGAFVAMAQTDFKKMVAYSSVSHMGFILLGMSAFTIQGFIGGYYQMFSHGILTGAMFLLVGVLYDRAHTRDLNSFGGLMAKMPIYAFVLAIMALGSLGLPGLSGFIAEFFTFVGSFVVYPKFTVAAVLAIVVTAAYILYMLQRVLLGPLNEKWKDLPDINSREMLTVVPLIIITIVLGVCPSILLNIINPFMTNLLSVINGAPH